MKLTLWQQYSANHSSSFTVVGEFPTPEAAQHAVSEIRRILQKIADWHAAHEEESLELFSSGKWVEQPSPPELELAQRYGINWRHAVDWYDKAVIEIQLDRYVFITPEERPDSAGQPFDQVMDKLGGKGFLEGMWGDSLVSGAVFTLTCDAPDDATAQAILDENIGYYRSIERTGTHLLFERWRVDEPSLLVELVDILEEKGCQHIEFTLSKYSEDEPLPVDADIDRLLYVLAFARDAGDRESAAERLRDAPDKRAFVPLLAALEDEDIRVQRAAAWALAVLDDERAVPPLIRLLETSSDDYTRETILRAIARFKSPRIIDGLIIGLQDSQSRTWHQAAQQLGLMGVPARSALQTLADRPDMAERVALALRLIDATEKGGELLERIRSTDDEINRQAVDEARQKRQVETLIAALENPSDYRQVRRVSAALGELGDARAIPVLIPWLASESEPAEALVMLGEPAVEPLLAYVCDKATPDWSRMAAIGILGQLGADQALITLLEDKHVRHLALAALTHQPYFWGGPGSSAYLALLQHEHPAVREAAIHEIYRRGMSSPPEALQALVDHDPSPDVRRTAQLYLDRYHPPKQDSD